MPSLSELNQFKSSFNNIAAEKADIESLHLPFNDLELPKIEPPPFNPSRDTPTPGGSAGTETENFDINEFMDNVDSPAGGALSALDDFLNDLNTPSEPAAEAGAGVDDNFLADLLGGQDESPLSETDPPPAMDDFPSDLSNDFSPPDDLLSGLSADMEEAPADFDTDDSPLGDDFGSGGDDFGSADFGGGDDFDAGNLGGDDFGSTDFGGGDDSFNTDDFNTDSFVSADEPAAEETEDDDSGGSIDMGGESPHFTPGASADSSDSDDFSTDDLNINDLGSEDFGSADFGSGDDFGDVDLPAEEAPSIESTPEPESSIDMGGESLDFVSRGSEDTEDDFSMDDALPDIDLPGSDDSGFGDSDFGAAPEDTLPDMNFSTGADDSDFGSGSMDMTPESGDGSAPFDMGDFGADFSSDSIVLDNEPAAAASDGEDFGDDSFGGDAFGSDDFTLSGLDDLLNKNKASTTLAPPPKKGLFGRKKEKVVVEDKPDDDIEEISLTQDDVDKLLRTLASYPLNLRIACEELIAEQVILPQQLSILIRLLVYGAHVKETAAHVESIIGKPIIIPKSFEKGTGAAFEAEQSSFAYIFIHNFLPVLKLFAIIAVLAASVIYLGYNYIYIPITAENLYKRGYERIPAGEFQRANDLFHQAFTMHRKKKWFYSYAEAFIRHRRYTLAEGKYDELLRFYPRDKKGVLDYAGLNTHYLMNYEKANRLLQRELLDYAPNDKEGLLAAGDNFLAWADSNPARFYDRYEDARFSYARLLDRYGWQPHVVERMMKYFIRTDNLREVLQLRAWFENSTRRQLSADSLAELGGYLLDKQLEIPAGVKDPYIESIESVRAMLLQAVRMEPTLPEPHYHLARYHKNLNNVYDERLTLENAIRAFDLARQESVRRRRYRVDAHYRYANVLIDAREFFPAEESVVRGIELFEDYLGRNLIPATPQLGQLYSLWGDLEYFVKTGNMEVALNHYHKAEGYGYAPPEVQYRMGSAYYQQENWRSALEYMFKASADLPLNRRLLYALGNAAYQRGDYFAAQGYYNRLLDVLELQRIRLPVLLPNDSVQFVETGERLMMARNNLGVVNEALAAQTGNRDYRSRAMAMYAESARAWDAITRNPVARDPVTREPNPDYMTRMRLTESPGAPSINLGYLNANNALRPNSGYKPEIFVRIDKDVQEPSRWEMLAP